MKGPAALAMLAGVVLALVFSPAPCLAADIICPVCHQRFSDEVEVCPNDGTDLKLLGKPAPDDGGEAAGDEEKGDGEPAEGQPGAADGADDSTPVPPEEKSGGTGYRRLDEEHRRSRGNARDRSSAYKDRRSRIATERRGKGASAAKRRKQAEAFAAADEERMAEYERLRSRAWEDRERLAGVEEQAAADRDAARERLLHGLGAPLTSIGFRMSWMGEGEDAGPLSTFEIDLNLARYRFRAGLSSLVGLRSLDTRDELVFLEHISLGFQWPSRFSPYIVARGGVGMLVTERFGADLVYLMSSAGVEMGIDCWLSPWIAVTPSLGYARYIVSGAYWDSFTFKISVGF
jgi:hypothetical protein